MRHDPAIAAIVIMLRELKMFGMAQAVCELAEQGAPAFEAAQPMLSQLLKAETAEREVRAVAYQLKQAKLPAYRDLAGFDFSNSEVNEALVRQLHRCEFMDRAENVVLVGGPGTGKTHLASAIGVQAVEHHRRRVRFFSTVELVNMLEQEKVCNKTGQMATPGYSVASRSLVRLSVRIGCGSRLAILQPVPLAAGRWPLDSKFRRVVGFLLRSVKYSSISASDHFFATATWKNVSRCRMPPGIEILRT